MESIRLHRGFTLVELMVVFAIITIIMAVVLTSQSSFNKTLILANTAYDIALTLRSIETYGIGSRAFGTTVNAGYGLHFESGTPGSFTLFADTNPVPSVSSVCHPISDASAPNAQPGDCIYEPDYAERVASYTLGNGITVSDFCAYALGGWSCAYAHGGGLTALDIVFARPNPEPFMSVNGLYSTSNPVTAACIAVTSPKGGAQYISVAASGQINANAAQCP